MYGLGCHIHGIVLHMCYCFFAAAHQASASDMRRCAFIYFGSSSCTRKRNVSSLHGNMLLHAYNDHALKWLIIIMSILATIVHKLC